MQSLAKIVSAAVFTIALAPCATQAAPFPVQTSFARNDSVIRPVGLSDRKAATKAWFKRKGHQTSNWFQRQKRKLEDLVD